MHSPLILPEEGLEDTRVELGGHVVPLPLVAVAGGQLFGRVVTTHAHAVPAAARITVLPLVLLRATWNDWTAHCPALLSAL